MSKNDADPAVKPPIWRVYAYRAAVVFFILGTVIQLPLSYTAFFYIHHTKHASLEKIYEMNRELKEKYGWSYDGDMQ